MLVVLCPSCVQRMGLSVGGARVDKIHVFFQKIQKIQIIQKIHQKIQKIHQKIQ